LQVGVGEGRWQGSVVAALVMVHWWGDSAATVLVSEGERPNNQHEVEGGGGV